MCRVSTVMKKKTWPRSGSKTGNSKGVEVCKTGSLGIWRECACVLCVCSYMCAQVSSLLLTPSAKNASSKWNNLYGRVETVSWQFYWKTDLNINLLKTAFIPFSHSTSIYYKFFLEKAILSHDIKFKKHGRVYSEVTFLSLSYLCLPAI